MDDRTESTDLQKQGKFTNWKRKGKLSELDRLKKRQRELHIMKLSQEWDARRHKRKMDRIQWLQQRKDQILPKVDLKEPTINEVEASSEEQRAKSVVLAKANNSPVSTNRAREEPLQSIYTVDNHRADENASGIKGKPLCEDQLSTSAESESYTYEPPNQVYKSVVVKTERQESARFSNSNYSPQSRQSNSRNSCPVLAEPGRKRRKKVCINVLDR